MIEMVPILCECSNCLTSQTMFLLRREWEEHRGNMAHTYQGWGWVYVGGGSRYGYTHYNYLAYCPRCLPLAEARERDSTAEKALADIRKEMGVEE